MAGYVAWNKVTEVSPPEGKDLLVWTGSAMIVASADYYTFEQRKELAEIALKGTIMNCTEEQKNQMLNCEGRFMEFGKNHYFDNPNIYWAELPLAPGEKNPPYEEPQFDSKDIYLAKDGTIIGLHAIGVAGPYEYDLVGIDGSTTRVKSDFDAIEAWVNEYDEEHNMLGRGSFRLSTDIEAEANFFEKEGWVRREAPKRKEK